MLTKKKTEAWEKNTYSCAAFAVSNRFDCGDSTLCGDKLGLTDTFTVPSTAVYIVHLKHNRKLR